MTREVKDDSPNEDEFRTWTEYDYTIKDKIEMFCSTMLEILTHRSTAILFVAGLLTYIVGAFIAAGIEYSLTGDIVFTLRVLGLSELRSDA